jgi:hypothetical protein
LRSAVTPAGAAFQPRGQRFAVEEFHYKEVDAVLPADIV